jgi:hypothetical protein
VGGRCPGDGHPRSHAGMEDHELAELAKAARQSFNP